MIPFPGEAVGILDAADITGGGEDYSLWEDVAYRAGSRTLAAGDEWRTFVYSGFMDYLEETGLDLTVEWVVEVTSGSVTVSATEGLDPTYSAYSDPLGTSLGSHTLTVGENRITSTFTGDQVADLSGTVSSAFILGLEATSGSAVVQQVKMYVYPAGGALGAFVEHDGFDTTPTAPLIRSASTSLVRSGTAEIPGYEASWDAAADALAADTVAPGPYTFATALTSGPTTHAYSDWSFFGAQNDTPGGEVSSSLILTADITVLRGPDPASQWPVADGVTGYIRPPTEVADEDRAYLYPQTGTATVGWVDAVVTVEQTGRADASVAAVTVAATVADSPTVTGETGSSFNVDVSLVDGGTTLTAPGAGATTLAAVPLLTSGRYLFAHLSHTAASTPPDWPGTTGTLLIATDNGINARAHFGSGDPASGSFSPVMAYVSMPPYRVWDPTATPAPARGIVRHYPRDDGVRGTSPKRWGGHRGSYQAGRQLGYQ